MPTQLLTLRYAILALVSLSLFCSPARAADKPLNFILVLVDDMGWMDLSCQDSDYYQTPNIDRLAGEGMRFTNGYAACAVCSPTRAAVQTGRYPGRVGVTDWIRSLFQRGDMGTPEKNPTDYVGNPRRKLLCPPNPYWMEHEERTLAEVLRDKVGYQTAYIGKWHLGDEAWYPPHQGYVVNKGGCDYGQPPNYFDPFNQPKHKHTMLRAGIPGLPGREPGQFLTHREGDEAAALIEKWKDQPFFIQMAHYAVHTPIQAIPEVAAKYQMEGKTQVNAKYAAMVESVDDAMGQMLAALEKHGIAERTVIVFTSDNGGLLGPTDNAPLRSGKGYAYEGGIRVPFIVRWPGVVPQQTVSDTPVCSIDIFPTLLEAAGIEVPQDRPVDGVSLCEHLKSGGNTALQRDTLLWHFPHYRHNPGPYSIIRKGDLKLIKFWEGIYELYDLKQDLGEQNNLATQMPDKVRELDTELVRLLRGMNARLPRENPQFQSR